MFIDVEFIDNKGKWHKETGKSRKLTLEFIKTLVKGTEIRWDNRRRLFISQQYVKEII